MKSKINMKSNMKKYSRKLKNKKFKCSRKMMSGGSMESPSTRPPLSFTFSHSLNSSNKKNIQPSSKRNTNWRSRSKDNLTIRKLEELYDCFIKEKKDLNTFEKYEYEYEYKNEYKMKDKNIKTKYLYRKKNDNKEINEVFNVYELTNTSIGIEYNKNKKQDEIGMFYELSLIDLNVDLIQLAINTNSLSISKDPNDGSNYLGFTNNFPALVYNNDRTSFTYTSRTNAKWTNVYEDNTFDKDDEFVIEKKDTNPNYPHPSHTPEFAEQNKITNQYLYMKKYSEIKDRLLSGGDIKDLLVQDIFRMRVKVECENDESLADLAKLDFIISQNINWVLKNALWLEKYLEIKKKSEYKDTSLTAQQLKSQIGEKYNCDLSDLDEQYIIVDEKTIDGIKYVICGYPEKKMKEIILNFWQENVDRTNETDINFCNELKELHKLKETLKLLIDFYNYKDYNNNKITLDNLDDISNKKDLFKFYAKIVLTFNIIINKFDIFYKDNPKLKNNEEYEKFIKNYVDNAKNYYNEIAIHYFNKIMTTIRYIFIVFIKNLDDRLTPMIFNVKELDNKHIPILERLHKLIKNELPYRFSILDLSIYNDISTYDNKNKYDSNNEYKLFYSSYKYGNFFNINAEFIHTMGNIYRKDYEYKQSITLEEIIYACSVYSEINPLLSYWKAVKINYNVREYGLSFPSPKQNKSRSEIVYDLYEKKQSKTNTKEMSPQNKNTTTVPFNNIFNNENLLNSKIKIIMIYKINIQSYKIILKYTNIENIDEIYILDIESSIIELINNIIKNLYSNIILNNASKSIRFNDIDRPKFFKVINIKLFTKEDYIKIFIYNPIVLYYINQTKRVNSIEWFQKELNSLISKQKTNNNNNNNTNMNKVLQKYRNTQSQHDNSKYNIVDTSIYYMNAMLNLNNVDILSYLINIYNTELYKIYPWIVKNFLQDTYYLSKKNEKNELYCQGRLDYEIKFKGCSSKNCGTDSNINCVYYNYEECGYDFIETIDNKFKKIVIYILPTNLNKDNQTHKYLGNIADLDGNSILMIKSLHKLYSDKKYNIFAHIINNTLFYCLHFHIIKTDNYKREKHFTEKGTYIIQNIFLEDIIKNLDINNNYYKDSNYCYIRQE